MASKILSVKYGADSTPIYDYLCDTETCRESLNVKTIAAGSTSYVAATKKTYILNNEKVWCEM